MLLQRTAESTLRLLCKVFDVETATVSLLTGERIHLVAACGALAPTICPDRWGFCGWSFLNSTHELNVVEDMEADTRCVAAASSSGSVRMRAELTQACWCPPAACNAALLRTSSW